MASFFASVSVPTDNGANAGTTATFANPPIAGMQAGDLVFVICSYRSASVTLTNSVSGGQTWSSGTNRQGASATLTVREFWCIFDGTWTAAPVFTNTTGTVALTAVMLVFRKSSGKHAFQTTRQDTTGTTDNAAPGSPFNCTVTGLPTNVNGASAYIKIYYTATDDDNTWSLISGPTGVTFLGQFRNTQGTDTSIGVAYGVNIPDQDVVLRQATLGGDPYFAFGSMFVEFPIIPPSTNINQAVKRASYW